MPDLAGILEFDKESSERPERRNFQVKKKHSAILRKREAEVATRLSPSWNGQARKTVLSSDGISYEVSEKIHAVSYGGLWGCCSRS